MPKKNPTTKPKRRWYKRPLIIIPLAVTLLLLAYPLISVGTWVTTALLRTPLDTVGSTSFNKPLPIPKLAKSSVSSDGTRVFNLALQTGSMNFFDGTTTKAWGINGSYLGPTLRAKRGEKIKINVRNNLPETSSLHWHGMHLPAAMDGGPHQPVMPGKTWSPYWMINQPAATLWYHPHPHGETEKHIYKGLAGMFIIDDDNPASTRLPHSYGKDDLPVIVQDKNFTADKQLSENGEALSATGLIGKEVLVNGARTPYFTATTKKIRLRLLNASTARIYSFGLSNGRDMQMIASDSGLLEKPVKKQRLLLSPGERAEVIVTMDPGETTTLRAYPFDAGAGSIANRLNGSQDTLEIMQLRANNKLAPSSNTPAHLATLSPLPETSAMTTRKFDLTSEETINNKTMDMKRVDFSVVKNSTEIWNVTNTHDTPHNFHIHDVQFRVISVDGKTPPPELQGRKDTIFIRPSQTVRLTMKFTDYSDPDTPYMFHCHLVRHEDKGMMGQFTVINPGQQPRKQLDMEDMPGMNHTEN